MINVKHDGEDIALERCCFCRKLTNYWYAAKDVACCEVCAKTADAADVPTKKIWIRRELVVYKSRVGCEARVRMLNLVG